MAEGFRNPALLEVTQHGFAGVLLLLGAEGDLDGIVAVGGFALYLHDRARTGFNNGYGHQFPGLSIDLGHAHFFAY